MKLVALPNFLATDTRRIWQNNKRWRAYIWNGSVGVALQYQTNRNSSAWTLSSPLKVVTCSELPTEFEESVSDQLKSPVEDIEKNEL